MATKPKPKSKAAPAPKPAKAQAKAPEAEKRENRYLRAALCLSAPQKTGAGRAGDLPHRKNLPICPPHTRKRGNPSTFMVNERLTPNPQMSHIPTAQPQIAEPLARGQL